MSLVHLTIVVIILLTLVLGVMTYVIVRLRHRLKMLTRNMLGNLPQLHSESSDEQTDEQAEDRRKVEDRRFVDKADEAQRLIKTFQKFVPKQFVDHIKGQDASTIELGKAAADEVAILFCDIRGFTGLSERMQPHELMKFLNSYFLRMNDAIHQNNGFIDKFIGDAIMALFDHPGGNNSNKALDSIRAAIDLHAALAMYNQQRESVDYPPVEIGVGVHFGPVIIGTVGCDDRMDTTVIGDSVNISYRLESLAPKYDADIIVSSQLLDQLTIDSKTEIAYRFVDFVRVKGRKEPIEVYEILNHLPKDIQLSRYKTGSMIQQGVEYRKNKDWKSAMKCFHGALMIDPEDSLVIHHMEQCHRMRIADLAGSSDGALNMI
ncbi:adenylate/guanylate cyclase domain-containing protein [Glaciecola sp. XM2]|uniref:adenylate/guanylate cyclase domain-containing protein n=1 Tax=Glaciecola sp. XM2 TaxID=1914931 RepID=UPI002032F50A|nr:adenylate/guanylate cyclase domain-containing protein [Glaciecola sp. XM2]